MDFHRTGPSVTKAQAPDQLSCHEANSKEGKLSVVGNLCLTEARGLIRATKPASVPRSKKPVPVPQICWGISSLGQTCPPSPPIGAVGWTWILDTGRENWLALLGPCHFPTCKTQLLGVGIEEDTLRQPTRKLKRQTSNKYGKQLTHWLSKTITLKQEPVFTPYWHR